MKRKDQGKSWTVVFIMICILVAGSFPGMAQTAHADNTAYYVDSIKGNDANNGTSASTAWKTLSKLNSTTLSLAIQFCSRPAEFGVASYGRKDLSYR